MVSLSEKVYVSHGYSFKQYKATVSNMADALRISSDNSEVTNIPLQDIKSVYAGIGTVKLKLSKGSISFTYKPMSKMLFSGVGFGMAGLAISNKDVLGKAKLWRDFAKENNIKTKSY